MTGSVEAAAVDGIAPPPGPGSLPDAGRASASTRAAANALARLAALSPAALAPAAQGRVAAFDGLVIEAEGLAAPVGEICRIPTSAGGRIDAEVVGFRDGRLILMSHAQSPALLPGAPITGTGLGALVPVGDALMGRVVDATGRPLDSGPPVRGGPLGPIAGAPIEPLARAAVDTPLWTGVRAIDALATLGRGQRIGLIAGAGVGKSTLLGMIAREAAADAVVVALVGERGREVADFVTRTLPADRRHNAVVVAAAADQPAVLRIRGALRACAIAEAWRARGRHVLLLFDSLTRVAHAQRELGLALGEPASARGYPPSALALIARLAERAGACARSGGSVTAVLTILADGDDPADPVVDAARAILDGHILLDRALAERGIFPAVDPARSLSRCMADLASPAQQAAARRVRRLHAIWEGSRDLIAMGAWKRGGDAELDAAVDARPAIEALLRQPADAPEEGPAAAAALVAAFAESAP